MSGERATTLLTLVRHGQTRANVDGVWHGSIDTPLNERGREQAQRVAAYLARGRADASALYASPLERAHHTAQAIAGALGLPVALDDDLREYHLGELEGTPYRVLTAEHDLFRIMRDEPDRELGGGESPRGVARRFGGALLRIAARHPGERVVVVGHGGALTLALGWLVDGDAGSWRRVMDNCAVSDLEIGVGDDAGHQLLTFNECAHALDAEDLAPRVLAYVREHDWVSFAALHKHFAGDSREETELVLPGNRVIWAGMPRALLDAITGLVERGELAALPGHPSAYRKDGRVLALPVEKAPPPAGHAEPHWFPVLLRTMEAARSAEAE